MMSIIIADHPTMTNAQRANAYYENLRDNIGIIGSFKIPMPTDPNYIPFMEKLNRYSPRININTCTMRIIMFDTFRKWSSIERFRNITIEELLEEIKILNQHTFGHINYTRKVSPQIMDRNGKNISLVNNGVPMMIVDTESDEIINICDLGYEN